MDAFIGLLSILGIIIGFIWLLIRVLKKGSKKQPVIIMLACFILFLIAVSMSEGEPEYPSASLPQNEDVQKSEGNTGDAEISDEEQSDAGFFITEDNVDDTLTEPEYGEIIVKQLIDLGFTVEEASTMQHIFLRVGIDSLSEIQAAIGTGIDNVQSFTAIANDNSDQKFFFTVENRIIFYAGFRDADLYDSDNGGILTNIDDVYIPNTEVGFDTYTKLQAAAEQAVKLYLNYPSTARFGLLDWGVGRSDDNYKIFGTVRAKNGFNVEEKMKFSVWFLRTGDSIAVEGVSIVLNPA
jgi:hypothetical protein